MQEAVGANVPNEPGRRGTGGSAKPLTCPGRHGLQPFVTTVAGYTCDICASGGVGLPKGTRLFSCRLCDFDVCAACFAAGSGSRPHSRETTPRGTMGGPLLNQNGVARQSPTVASAGVPSQDGARTDSEGEQRSGKERPGSKIFAGPSVEKLKQIQALLDSPGLLTMHGRSWFARFASPLGIADEEAMGQLISALNADMNIPPVDEATVSQVVAKFDRDSDGLLNAEEFQGFYSRLLAKVRDHYAVVRVRRDCFLNKQAGKPSEWYVVKKSLGQGAFGSVQLVTDTRTGRPFVLKTINKTKSKLAPEILEQEIRNMKALDHPHVIKLFEYFEDEQNICIVMEFCEGGEVLKVIDNNFKAGRYVNEAWAAEVFYQVLEAVAYCHSRGVMHKDIKAENIMLLNRSNSERPHAVVIDFGLAEMFQSPILARSRVVSGTPYTMAPEVWEGARIKSASIGYRCDIYSLGCVLFHVLTGDLPVLAKDNDPESWLQAISKGPKWSAMAHVTPEGVEICKAMMSPHEKDRPTARGCLDHPWFQKMRKLGETFRGFSAEQKDALDVFVHKSSFEKAVLMNIATMSRAVEIHSINEIYYAVSRKCKWKLDVELVRDALVSLGLNADLAVGVTKALDIDADGRVEYTEFVAGFLGLCPSHMDKLLFCVFSSMDSKGVGTLTTAEIREFLMQGTVVSLGVRPSEKEVALVVASIDKEKRGRVTFDQFKSFFSK